MADIVSTAKRSQMMAGIRSKNTRPEIAIRTSLHAAGFRYRLHVKGLPGKPDIVFPKYNAIIFVHGCFWHGHNCSLFKMPTTRVEFWETKISRNKETDKSAIQSLLQAGWRVCVIWECSIRGRHKSTKGDVTDSCKAWLLSDVAFLELRSIV
jgi:DNA mismatch endonuclease (patch repair protein)